MKALSLHDFAYSLPEHAIPAYPLANRAQAKLLRYEKGKISHHNFHSLPELLPDGALLVFNDTRVIPARLFFHRETGARIEVLLLEPSSSSDMHQVMQSSEACEWNCMIGGLKKWKDDEVLRLDIGTCVLEARLKNRTSCTVELKWNATISLSEVLDASGKLPLPPYLHRETEASDKERYQTVYAENEGAVAAPTAGLHFTQDVIDRLSNKSIHQTRLTLHVGAGTFKPVKVDDPRDHDMHNEKMCISRKSIVELMEVKGPIVPVGTTSMRTLESLYIWGCKLIENPSTPFIIEKLEAYSLPKHPTQTALQAILKYMDKLGIDEVYGQTEILIYPGYQFALCGALITNFHLPETTLIMLVAAFIGEDWRTVYDEALQNEYRFLSFGDSSLLIP